MLCGFQYFLHFKFLSFLSTAMHRYCNLHPSSNFETLSTSVQFLPTYTKTKESISLLQKYLESLHLSNTCNYEIDTFIAIAFWNTIVIYYCCVIGMHYFFSSYQGYTILIEEYVLLLKFLLFRIFFSNKFNNILKECWACYWQFKSYCALSFFYRQNW